MVARCFIFLAVLSILLAAGCSTEPKVGPDFARDQVFQTTLSDVRLADGVPLSVKVTVRWRVENREAFLAQFAAPEKYGQLVFQPKSREIANRVANTFPAVEPVFKADRARFLQAVKQALQQGLKEPAVAVKEVILSDLVFPRNFTDAMEQVALKNRELEAIKERNIVDIEAAKARERIAEAEGQVQLKKAEIEAKVSEINAKTEDKRRANAMAKAETDSQIDERRAKTEATRAKLLAAAEAERQRGLVKVRLEEQKELKELDVQKQRDLDRASVDKQRDLDRAAIEKDQAQAQLCATNPAYASFLINRELASKVQIAVVPLGTDANFLGGLLQNSMTAKTTAAAARPRQ
jgi:hypothetical protein